MRRLSSIHVCHPNKIINKNKCLRFLFGAVWIAAAALGAGFSSAGDTVTVGSKRFTESYILGEIVTQRIQSAGGARAEHRQGLGNTAILFAALKSGAIDVYADYTGTLAFELLGLKRVPALAELNAALDAHGLAAGVPLGFGNSYALAMSQARAAELGIASISDLQRHADLRYGLSQEFLHRRDGWPALRGAYMLSAQPAGLDHGLAYEAIKGGTVDVIDVYTTDAKLGRYGLKVLIDDRAFFPPYEAVLVYRKDLPQRHPLAFKALQPLERGMTSEVMIRMNAAVELDRQSFQKAGESGAKIQFQRKLTPLRLALEILQNFSLGRIVEGAHLRTSHDNTGPSARNFSDHVLQLAGAVTSEDAGVADSALAALQICELTLRWIDAADIISKPSLAPADQAEPTVLPPPAGSSALQADSSTALEDCGDGAGGSAEEYADEPGIVVAEDLESLNDLGKVISLSKVNAPPGPIQRFTRSYWYREWNYTENRHLEAWCRVIEQRLVGEDTDFISAVHRRHPKLWQQIKRSFALLRPASFKRVHRTTDGDELDLDRLIERQAERHIKRSQDDAVFVRRERALRDVSVAFLVDMSASTSILIPLAQTDVEPSETIGLTIGVTIDETDSSNDYPYLYGGGMSARTYAPIDEPQAEPNKTRRVIDVAQDAVALISEALHHLGDDFAVYGFSGDGREQVDFFIAKEFEEHVSGRTWAALSAMQPKQSSRVGPAIRHSTHKILKHTTGRRLLIVISDGYPQDREYGPAREDVEYGVQDTGKALREAERQGVQTFFVTIDPAGYDYLGRMCPENRYLLIEDVRELPAALSKIYRSMKAAPSKQTSFSNTKTFSAG